MRTIICLTFFSITKLLWAQNNSNPNDYLQRIVPPSPNASALGKYGEVPVSNYNGLPSISIPLTPLTTRSGFTLPIGLSYHAGGVKINDVPSSVGMNWSLNAGGVITRTIRGLDDFDTYGCYHNRQGIAQWQTIAGVQANSFYQTMLDHLNGLYDTQSDLYYFSLPSQSGKFVYDKDKVIRTIPLSNVAIGLNYTVSQADNTLTFNVTDAEGNKYMFETREHTGINTITASSTGFTSYVTAVYLTKIILTDGDEIQFAYTQQPFNYPISTNQSMSVQIDGFGCTGDPDPAFGLNFGSSTNLMVSDDSRLLSSITYRNYSVHFSYSAHTTFKRLTGIDYKYNQTPYLRHELNYEITHNGERFWLKEVKTLPASGQSLAANQVPIYHIDYHNHTQLPARLYKDQDHWGYYNINEHGFLYPPIPPNVQNFSNACLVAVNLATDYFAIHGGKLCREPHATRMLYGAIKSITYPTGGLTEFEFEPNQYMSDNNTIMGGGIRLKKMINKDGTSTVAEKHFSYAGGKLMAKPQYISQEAIRQDCQSNSTRKLITSSSGSAYPLSASASGGFVGYDQVTVKNGANGNNGYIVYEYNNEPNEEPRVAADVSMVSTNQETRVHATGSFYSKTLPRSVQTNDFAYINGSLLKEEYYRYNSITSISQLAKSITYTYDHLNCSAGDETWNYIINTVDCVTGGFQGTVYDPWMIVLYRDNVKYVRLINKTTRDYDRTGAEETGTNYTQTVETYQYQELLNTNTFISSGDMSHQTQESRSYITTPSSLTNHNPHFRYAKPVSLTKARFGNVYDEQQITYNANLQPTLHKEKNSTALAQASGNTGLLAPDRESQLLYDNNKQLVQVNSVKSPPVAYLWDTDMGKLVAEAVNAANGQLFVTSFETAFTGGFTYLQSGTVSSLGSKTGEYAYTLSTQALTFEVRDAGTYKFTFWAKSGASSLQLAGSGTTILQQISEASQDGWVFYEWRVQVSQNNTTLTFSGDALVDEVRCFPEVAQVKSYTYHPFWGLLSVTDERGSTSRYEYDVIGRLALIRDNNGYIIKKMGYNLR